MCDGTRSAPAVSIAVSCMIVQKNVEPATRYGSNCFFSLWVLCIGKLAVHGRAFTSMSTFSREALTAAPPDIYSCSTAAVLLAQADFRRAICLC